MPITGNTIADLFATMGLDATAFHEELQKAKIGLVNASNDMALSLKAAEKALGPTAFSEALSQLQKLGLSLAHSKQLIQSYYSDWKVAQDQKASSDKDYTNLWVNLLDKQESAMHQITQSVVVDLNRQKQAQKEWADYVNGIHSQAIAEDRAMTSALKDNRKQMQDLLSQGVEAEQEAASTRARIQRQQIVDLQRTSYAFTQAGFIITAAVAPVDAALVGSVAAFSSFDAAMTKSLAVMRNVSEAQRGELSDAARQLALTTTTSATEAAGALYNLASAGLNVQETIQALPVVNNFAIASHKELASSVDVLVISTRALGLWTNDSAANIANLTRVSDLLVAADQRAVGSASQFADALQNKAAAALRLANKSAEEGVAVLAALSEQGIQGAKAGDFLYRVLRDLESKAVSNSAAFKQLGISVYDASGQVRNTADILKQLEDRFSTLSPEQVRAELNFLKFGDRAASVLQILLGTSDRVKELEADFRTVGSVTQQVADNSLKSFQAQVTILKHQINDLAISVGSELVKAFGSLVDKAGPVNVLVQGMIEHFKELSPAAKTVVVELAAIGAGLTTMGGVSLVAIGQVVRLAADLKTLGVTLKGVVDILGVTSIGGAAGLVGLLGVSLVAALSAATKEWNNYKEGLDRAYQRQKEFYELWNKQHPTGGRAQGPSPETDEEFLKRLAGGDKFTAEQGKDVTAQFSGLKVSIEGIGAAAKLAKPELAGMGEELDLDGKKAKAAAKELYEAQKEEVKAANEKAALAKAEQDYRDRVTALLKKYNAELKETDGIAKANSFDMAILADAERNRYITLEQLTRAQSNYNAKVGEIPLEKALADVDALNEKLQKSTVSMVKLAKWLEDQGFSDRDLSSLGDQERSQDLRDKRILGLDPTAEEGATRRMEAFNRQLESQYATLGQVEIEWAQISRDLERIGRTNLPVAISYYESYIQYLKQHQEALGMILQLEAQKLQLIIRERTLRGESADSYIVQLENIRIKQDVLRASTQALGEIYVKTIGDLKQSLKDVSQGFASLILDGGKFGNVMEKVLDRLAHKILEDVIEGALKKMGAEIIRNTDLLGKLGSLGSKIPGLGGLLGALGGGGSPVQLPGELPVGGDISLPNPGASGGAGGGTASGASGLLGTLGNAAGVAGAIASIGAGITQGIQMAQLLSDTGKIEVSTRASKQQLISIQGTLNTYLPLLTNLTGIWSSVQDLKAAIVQNTEFLGELITHGAGSTPAAVFTTRPLPTTGLVGGDPLPGIEENTRLIADAVTRRGPNVLAPPPSSGYQLKPGEHFSATPAPFSFAAGVETLQQIYARFERELGLSVELVNANIRQTIEEGIKRGWIAEGTTITDYLLGGGIKASGSFSTLDPNSPKVRYQKGEISAAEFNAQTQAGITVEQLGSFTNATALIESLRLSGQTDLAILEMLHKFPVGTDFGTASLYSRGVTPGYSGGYSPSVGPLPTVQHPSISLSPITQALSAEQIQQSTAAYSAQLAQMQSTRQQQEKAMYELQSTWASAEANAKLIAQYGIKVGDEVYKGTEAVQQYYNFLKLQLLEQLQTGKISNAQYNQGLLAAQPYAAIGIQGSVQPGTLANLFPTPPTSSFLSGTRSYAAAPVDYTASLRAYESGISTPTTTQPWTGGSNIFNFVVPNPDGDVVIQNFMEAAAKRGVRLI